MEKERFERARQRYQYFFEFWIHESNRERSQIQTDNVDECLPIGPESPFQGCNFKGM